MLTAIRPAFLGILLLAAACSGGGGNDDDDTTAPTNDDDSTVGDDTANDDDDTAEPFDPAQLAGHTWALPDQALGDFVSPEYIAEFLGPMYDDASGPKLLIGFDGSNWTPTPMLDLDHQDWTGSRHAITVTEQGGERHTIEIARESGFRLVQTNIKLDLFDVRTILTFDAAHPDIPLAVTRFRFFPPVGSAFEGVCDTHPDSCTPDGAVEFVAENVRVLELPDPPEVFASPLEGCQEDPAVDWQALAGTEWEMVIERDNTVIGELPADAESIGIPFSIEPDSNDGPVFSFPWIDVRMSGASTTKACLQASLAGEDLPGSSGVTRMLFAAKYDEASDSLVDLVLEAEGLNYICPIAGPCWDTFYLLATGMTARRVEP